MRRLAFIVTILLFQVVSSQHAVGYPDPSDTRRWADNRINFNLSPNSFAPNSSRWNQVIDALGSWWVPGSTFGTYYYNPQLNADPSTHDDSLSTIGFVGTIQDPLVLGVTDYVVFPGTTTYREADISLNGNASWDTPGSPPDSFPPYNVFDVELAVRHEAFSLRTLLFLLLISGGGSRIADGAGITLELSTDRQSYPEGAPVLVGVSLVCGGAVDVELPPLDPAYGYLTFSLTALPSGERISPGLPESPLQLVGGLLLHPGESQCQVVDVARIFGRHDGTPGTVAHLLGAFSLQPGDYVLTARYSPTLNPQEVDRKTAIASSALAISVRPLADYPSEKNLVEAFVQGANWSPGDGRARTQYSRRWLDRFYGSAYFTLIYLSSGPEMTRIPLEQLLKGLQREGASGLQRAALVGFRFQLEPMGNRRKLEWIRAIRGREHEHFTSCVASSWERRAAQHKFDYSKGP